MSNIGARVIENIKRPDKELIEQFRGIPSSNIGDMMNRLYCTNGTIKCFSKGKAMLGTAYTVKCPEGDNLMMHLAIELAQPGDIIVVDAGGCNSRSLCGEMMFNEAFGKGILGFVCDGAIRDIEAIEDLDFCVYASGVTPQGPYKNGPGEINVPVSIGGLVINPGDILVGDDDGVCVIRPEDAPEIIEEVHKKHAGEVAKIEGFRKGIYPDDKQKYIDAVAKKGIVFVEK